MVGKITGFASGGTMTLSGFSAFGTDEGLPVGFKALRAYHPPISSDAGRSAVLAAGRAINMSFSPTLLTDRLSEAVFKVTA